MGLVSNAFNILGLNTENILGIRKFVKGGFGLMTRGKGSRYVAHPSGKVFSAPNVNVSRITERTANFLASMLGAAPQLKPIPIRAAPSHKTGLGR